MDLGDPGQDDDVRRFRRTRNWFLAACTLVSAVVCVFVAGAIAEVVEGGVSRDLGVFTAIDVLVGALAVVIGMRARYWHQRARDRRRRLAAAWAAGRPAVEPVKWLPSTPADPTMGPQTTHVLLVAARNAAIAVIFLVPLVIGWVAIGQLTRDSQDRLDHGTRVTGTVVGTYTPHRGLWAIYVCYPLGETSRTARIKLEHRKQFAVGDPVTVIYDPADPARVRTPEDENPTDFETWLGGVPFPVGLIGVLIAGAASVSWLRRYAAVRRTGWHPASVVVDDVGRIFVTYPDRSTLELGGVVSIRRATRVAGEPRRAWIGGEAWPMVMLVERDYGKRPYLVPVRAEDRLRPPPRPRRRSSRRRRAVR
ncbi:DUF3592 domain-containing protein [Amycolatopsis granulosa]|uniref:DUF3592 domain-containing protein n=1 Tax=Amycolatopsis granulosa TaxID=185684 RepID=UPI00141E3F5F|nr:DUF3592 domain-containing protein [Amycolatopsis granulosa]NIH87206.1 hypothetical protein [Amycolatopsis granulosa]